MKGKVLGVLIVLVCLPQIVWALTGREIVEKGEKISTPDSGISTVKMMIYKGGNPDIKTFTIYGKKYPDNENKALVQFHKPTQIQLLTHIRKDKEADQWIVLSSGKIKRIASADKGNSFMHSHFYYEDLGVPKVDDFNYNYTGDEKVMGQDCYKVESVKKKDDDNKVYDKRILYFRKSDYFPLRVDFYQNGKFLKYLENRDIKKVSGMLTPFTMVMTMADGKERTELKVQKVDYNTPIPDAKFRKEALR